MNRFSIACLLSLALGAACASAQQQDPPEKGDPLPSLDELLGTGGTDTEKAAEGVLPEDAPGDDLDTLLSGKEIVDEFKSAVDLMERSARRISASKDTGIATQRMQEDVLQKLDKLIADAEKRAQQGGNSSSSSANNQQPQQSQQPNQQSSPQAGKGDNHGEATPPGLQTGALRPEEASDLAAWGALPARLRDALIQGSSDRFSATYRKLTEAYYKRLAEEPKP
ncbi:MAG: hypothetical protein IPJ41_06615 [Phycisphaerales bacterium]|nr:hypothetical protein [Phycisphaerales bacterium]